MNQSLFETYVLSGGPLMVLLLLCSLLLVAAIVQNFVRFRQGRVLPRDLVKRAGDLGSPAEREQYLKEIDSRSAPLARIVSTVASRLHLPSGPAPSAADFDRTLEESVIHTTDDMYDKLGLMAGIYTVAPLLGLLGTILGMMSAFREFSEGAQRDLSDLSQGIQQALVTTLWGLAIAIVAFSAAQYFQVRIRRYERNDLPAQARRILDAIVGPRQPAPVASGSAVLHGGASAVALHAVPAEDDSDVAEIPILEPTDEEDFAEESSVEIRTPPGTVTPADRGER